MVNNAPKTLLNFIENPTKLREGLNDFLDTIDICDHYEHPAEYIEAITLKDTVDAFVDLLTKEMNGEAKRDKSPA